MILIFDYIIGRYSGGEGNYIVVENNGIGFKIYVSAVSSARLCGDNNEIKVYTYLNVREDAMDLFGFATKEERSSFMMLTGVSGVGPKVAMNILSAITPSEMALAIATNAPKIITKASGVGPKMAQRIILELKDKVKSITADAGETVTSNIIGRDEAAEALMALGYSADEAARALQNAPADVSTEERIKIALKGLM